VGPHVDGRGWRVAEGARLRLAPLGRPVERGRDPRAAVRRTDDVHRHEAARLDDADQVHVHQVQAGGGPQVPEQAWLDVFRPQWLGQQGVVHQIDLTNGQVVRHPPVRVDRRDLRIVEAVSARGDAQRPFLDEKQFQEDNREAGPQGPPWRSLRVVKPLRDEDTGRFNVVLVDGLNEETAAEMYTRRKIGGFLHLYVGEEAVAVGTIGALEPDDYIVSHYREPGHALARGLEPSCVVVCPEQAIVCGDLDDPNSKLSRLIERHPDPSDRRAWLLHLTPAARPKLTQLRWLGEVTRGEALAGVPEADAERVGLIRKTVGKDVAIMLDANQGWDLPTAVRAAKLCEPHDIFWLEDPMPWFDERGTLARLKAETRIPIAAGETEYSPFGLRTMVVEGLVDYLIIDSTWAGGLTTWRKAAVMAEMYQIPMAAHHDPQIHIHLACAVPNALILETFPNPQRDPLWANLFTERATIETWTLVPGLSCAPGFLA